MGSGEPVRVKAAHVYIYFPWFVWSFTCIEYGGAGGNGSFDTSHASENARTVVAGVLHISITALLVSLSFSKRIYSLFTRHILFF